MDICGAHHPSVDAVCESRGTEGDHPEHFAVHDGEVLEWPNAGFVRAKVSKAPRRNRKGGLVEIAERTRSRDAETFQDPGVNVAGGVRPSDPETSLEAALSIAPRTGTQRRAILDAFGEGDAWTHQDLEAQFPDFSPSSVRTRCSELVKGGWIQDSGHRRETEAGLRAVLWTRTPKRE